MISTLIISVITLTGVVCIFIKQPKMAYVRIPYLYANFQYKKEMEAKLTNVMQSRKLVLDSLELHLKVFAGRLQKERKPDDNEIAEFNYQKEQFLNKKGQFEEDDNNASKRYADEILKQLTQYVQDYGKDNGYTYIIGAEGTGALMAADEKNDITTPVLAYINEKYKGNK
jgi:outer membrane protein